MNTEWIELKGIEVVATAVAAGMEIEFLYEADDVSGWVRWDGTSWSTTMRYRARHRKPAEYEHEHGCSVHYHARAKCDCKPKTVKVKSLCWRSTVSGSLIWYLENGKPSQEQWQRFPSGDISGEVEV